MKINPKFFVLLSPPWAQHVLPSGLLSLKLILQLCCHANISTSSIPTQMLHHVGLCTVTKPTKQIPTFYQSEMDLQEVP